MMNIIQFIQQNLQQLMSALNALAKLAASPAIQATFGASLTATILTGLAAKFGQPVLDYLKKTFGPLLLQIAGFLNKITNGALAEAFAVTSKALKPISDLIAGYVTFSKNGVDALLAMPGLALKAASGLLSNALALLKKLLAHKK